MLNLLDVIKNTEIWEPSEDSHIATLEDQLASELTIEKFSRAFAAHGMPKSKYSIIGYRQLTSNRISVEIHFISEDKKSTVHVTLDGPRLFGKFDWGMDMGSLVVKNSPDGVTEHYISGYLRPV